MSAAGPTVCVALPVRNGRAYFAQAIESVLAQEGVALEVRVLDNGSDDGSLELARSYAARDPRVVVAPNPFDVGYYGSLNRALAETACDHFVPFASDDVMYPGNLARKVEALEATGAGLASSSADQIAPDGSPLGTIAPDHRHTPRLTAAPGFFRWLTPQNAISCQSVVVRVEALRAIGGFDARSYYAADWLSWMRLSLRHDFVTLPESLIANRLHPATITTTGNLAGLNGRDVPATLDHVFGDERVPAQWRSLRDELVGGAHRLVAESLHADGIRRVEQGWAAYLALLRALARTPGDGALGAQLRDVLGATGLVTPPFPAEVVAHAPLTADGADALARGLQELGPLVGRVVLAVAPEDADAAVAVLEPVFDAGPFAALDVALVPGASDRELFLAGRLALIPWGSEQVATAEEAGVPVYPYAAPDPFAFAPDATRWQTVDAARCLA
jgi:glycosyltransferase involved in cell wall biosynthesis